MFGCNLLILLPYACIELICVNYDKHAKKGVSTDERGQ